MASGQWGGVHEVLLSSLFLLPLRWEPFPFRRSHSSTPTQKNLFCGGKTQASDNDGRIAEQYWHRKGQLHDQTYNKVGLCVGTVGVYIGSLMGSWVRETCPKHVACSLCLRGIQSASESARVLHSGEFQGGCVDEVDLLTSNKIKMQPGLIEVGVIKIKLKLNLLLINQV